MQLQSHKKIYSEYAATVENTKRAHGPWPLAHDTWPLALGPRSLAPVQAAEIASRLPCRCRESCPHAYYYYRMGLRNLQSVFLVQMWSRLPGLDASSALTSSQRPNVKRTCWLIFDNICEIVEDPHLRMCGVIGSLQFLFRT